MTERSVETTLSPVAGGHLWVAALISIIALAIVTLVLCGISLDVARKLVIGQDERASTSKFPGRRLDVRDLLRAADIVRRSPALCGLR